MMNYLPLKKKLFEACVEFVDSKLSTIEETISSNQKALQSETKSSAGDKHETGRAMLQLEMEKAGQQLIVVSEMKETLAKVNCSITSSVAHLGSIVVTDQANYFISVSAGKLSVEGIDYFAISTYSPIGKLLLGKQSEEFFFWNKKAIEIITVK